MANEWYVQHGGKQYGPLTGANLKKLAAEGKITPTTSVRLGGEGAWVQASRVQGLFAATAAPTNNSAPGKKTPTPGVQQKSASPSAPPLQPPAPPPRAKPLGMPVARRAPLPKAVPTDTGSLAP
ncbi:MAG TPA: DUF4339 domain-containing protein, partial [Pirellulales bacterium]|nr:DUF4339 domain-containing protein [Pirellulales bacterium]